MFHRISAIVLSVLSFVAIAGCSPAQQPAPRAAEPPVHYQIKGGGSAISAVKRLTDAFTAAHPGTTFAMEDVGSDAGVQLTAEGAIPFGMISRDLRPAERGKVDVLQIGASGTGILLNKNNPVQQLTHDQIRDIFAGRITTWDQVGGLAAPIKVFIREAESSTRSTFEAFAFDGKATYSPDAIEVYELDPMLNAVRDLTGAVGMATTDSRTLSDTSVHFVHIDGVPPTVEAIQSGQYPIRRPLSLTYRAAELSSEGQAFLDFARGPEGRSLTSL
ncbi:MAG: phosphate ABC transporter substrate-binding protein [Chloroflexota bacterium]